MQYLSGIILSFFLFSLLLLKKGKSAADTILTVWMAVMGVHQLLFYLDFSGVLLQCPHLLGVAIPFPLLHGVLLFFYVSALTKGRLMRRKTTLLHFIPFLGLYLLAIPFYRLSGAEKIRVFENQGAGFEWVQAVQAVFIMASGLGYTAWSLWLIRKHRRKVQDIFSNTDKKELQWLQYLSIGLGLIWLLVLFFDDKIIFTGAAALVLFIGFFGINQLPIFQSGKVAARDSQPLPLVDFAENEQPEQESVRYAKSGLKEDDAHLLYQRLTSLMQTEAPFKNNELTLADLAKSLGIHSNYLSQVVNEKEGKNFYNYINTLRVEEFIRLASLPENQKYTLLSLAYDCGFNSKSTFNKYFRTVTGKTPSEYFDFLKD
ncbi:MAG: helix-turn-helix domain-containing protein [Saprospiraceae bacterium]|nr:helix-turn-helix domain-containing protein [Saprospiraceae bacterium]MCF8251122.1 helix-turn-helix domain-containing protein [Saprospiraceae bacterium]MCF8282966.1 helix-turn-helix domain-containing protein [Bacteroidales bacterium]MCF8312920.1 helix-turn-helix domain-containing protein [Saprospiraceae bacterium]MCF8441381.1 helix-turn-helix domain-containing protein [Saprospiraceae bacterium]